MTEPLRPTPPDVEISAEELQADISAGRRFYLPIAFESEGPAPPADDSKPGPWLDIVEVAYLNQNLAIYDPEGKQKAETKGAISYRRPTVLHALPNDAIMFEFGGAWIRLNAEEPSDPALAEQFRQRLELARRIRDRNARIPGLVLPPGLFEAAARAAAMPLPAEQPAPLSAIEYYVHTAQEWTALMQAATDGKDGVNYRDDPQALARVHQRPGAPFHTRFSLLDDEQRAGLSLESLRDLTGKQDADSALALLYISHLLVPPTPLPARGYPGGWVDFNDVAKKIGLRAHTAADAEKNRAAIWNAIRFAARANVTGERNHHYFDQATKERIPTVLSGPPWALLAQEKPVQPALFASDTIPLRVELVMSREWARLLMQPETAQYLPFGEVLGGIAPDRPGGAYARIIGLAYLNFCRRNPREVLAGTMKPTRRELLATYRSKWAHYEEVLAGKNPSRLVEHWRVALTALAEPGVGILKQSGEAVKTRKQWEADLAGKRKTWQQPWLDGEADIFPGPRLLPAVRSCAEALPGLARRSLPGPKRGKRTIA